jgi:hypothetical protein
MLVVMMMMMMMIIIIIIIILPSWLAVSITERIFSSVRSSS